MQPALGPPPMMNPVRQIYPNHPLSKVPNDKFSLRTDKRSRINVFLWGVRRKFNCRDLVLSSYRCIPMIGPDLSGLLYSPQFASPPCSSAFKYPRFSNQTYLEHGRRNLLCNHGSQHWVSDYRLRNRFRHLDYDISCTSILCPSCHTKKSRSRWLVAPCGFGMLFVTCCKHCGSFG
jgi:hypothetical protein